jgi:hypothetical protein
MSMIKLPNSGHNVVSMPSKPGESRILAGENPGHAAKPATLATAGSPGDPRMKEAMHLIEAFLAIEDEAARTALIALAERLVTHDWARNVQQR